MRLVLDTDVVVAAMRSRTGASFAILEAARRGAVTLCGTVALCLEYESVCRRREHRTAAELSEAEVGIYIDAIIDLIEPASNFFLWRPQLRDPGNELVLEAAINASAGTIVTFNRRDYLPAVELFGIEAMLPRDIIMRIR